MSLSQWLTEDSLRAWNGVWRDNSGRGCALYETKCEYVYLAVPVEGPRRIGNHSIFEIDVDLKQGIIYHCR